MPLVLKRGVAAGELHNNMTYPLAFHLPRGPAVEAPPSAGETLSQRGRILEHSSHPLALEELRLDSATYDALKKAGKVLLVQ